MLFQTFTVLTAVLALVSGQKLQQYKITLEETSVSGISAGGFFASQMQIAYSSIIKGAGIIAAGHYNCGGEKYVSYCMGVTWPYSNQVATTKSWSGSRIDDIENMKKQKVYIISGTKDTVVVPGNVNLLYDFYKNFIPEANIVYKKDIASGHTFPTDFDSTGNNACSTGASPYISNCGFDGAGAILGQIYGTLKAKTTPAGELLTFDQSEFYSNPSSIGLADLGYVYVPTTCKTKKCSLHVVFHGCLQSSANIGTRFIDGTGYNRWADSNKFIILYPQAKPDNVIHSTVMNGMMSNPNACFDWVGWYDAKFQSREGLQMATVRKMIDRIAAKI